MRAKHMRGVWCCVLEVRGGAHHISRKHSSPSSWRPKERSKQSGSCTHQLLMRRAGARHHQQDRSTARGSNQRHLRHQRRFLSVGRARLSKRSRMTLNFIEHSSTLVGKRTAYRPAVRTAVLARSGRCDAGQRLGLRAGRAEQHAALSGGWCRLGDSSHLGGRPGWRALPHRARAPARALAPARLLVTVGSLA